MSGPSYARLARRVLEEGDRGSTPPPTPENRASAIALLEQAIAGRAQARRRSRWKAAVATVAAAAAVVVATVGGVRHYAHRGELAAATASSTGDVRVVGHAVSGMASVVVSGEAGAVTEGRAIAAGSRVVTAPTGRLLLAFSTGTSALLEEGSDVTMDSMSASQQIRLDSGSLDLHVARQGPEQHFVVRTRDAEVEVRGTQFRVAVAPADPTCGGGTTTRVAVSEGVVVVRHAGSEARVGAGEQWPAGCGAAPTATIAGPVVIRAAPGRSTASTLGEQNDLFAQAIAAKRRGDAGSAIAGFDRFLARYPGSPLAESATVERMRLLRSSESPRAPGAAKAYLARYPNGFAHSEAVALMAGSP